MISKLCRNTLTFFEIFFASCMSILFIMGYIFSIYLKNSPSLLSLEEITGIFLVSVLLLFLFLLFLKKNIISTKIIYPILVCLGVLYMYIHWKNMYYIFPDGSRYFCYDNLIFMIVHSLGPIFFTYLVTKK